MVEVIVHYDRNCLEYAQLVRLQRSIPEAISYVLGDQKHQAVYFHEFGPFDVVDYDLRLTIYTGCLPGNTKRHDAIQDGIFQSLHEVFGGNIAIGVFLLLGDVSFRSHGTVKPLPGARRAYHRASDG